LGVCSLLSREAPGRGGGASATDEGGPAVRELLQRASEQAEAGEGERAAATLERALRIEPANPWLWHRLAVLRLQQGYPELAIHLAARSSELARGDARLLAGNRQVIRMAREYK
jgi:Tfp pilus assembly protein PilF